MTPDQHQAAADALAKATTTRIAIEPLTDTYADMTAADGYAVQLQNARRKRGEGAVLKGHKIGATSRAIQKLFNVAEPDYGHLFDDMFVHEASSVDTSRFIAPMVECELAFILKSRLEGPGLTVADAVRAVDFVLGSIEIIDSRIAGWRIKLPDTVADNGSSGACVLGGRPMRVTDLDPRTIPAEVWVNGVLAASGITSAVLGNPLTVIAWLANTLAPHEVALEEGHVIMTGSATTAEPVRAGDEVRCGLGPLGDVQINFS